MSGQAVRNSALLSGAALASRLLGWVRLIVLVAAFGADGRLDPYLAAFKVPDIIYQLIAAGPLSSVLVPLVVRLRSEGDELRARRIMSAIFLIFGVLALVIAVAALLLAGGLAELLAPGISAAQREEVAQLSRILAPSSLGLGIVAVASVWSAANERFFASSIGPIVYNLSVILFTLFGAERFGTVAAALGTVVGALLFGVIAIADARRWTAPRAAFAEGSTLARIARCARATDQWPPRRADRPDWPCGTRKHAWAWKHYGVDLRPLTGAAATRHGGRINRHGDPSRCCTRAER